MPDSFDLPANPKIRADEIRQKSLAEANRERGRFSGHGRAKGAAGYLDPDDASINADFLSRRDDTLSVSPPTGGFGEITIGAAWDNCKAPDTSLMGKIFKKTKEVGIDLDLGCLYELHDGHRGAIQAFGNQMGSFNNMPFMSLSGDERTGDADGDDESIHINGAMWPKIKRLLVYIYIYKGTLDWAMVKPQIQVRVPGQKPMVVTLASHHKHLGICAIAGLENVRNGIRLINYTEYFPGHAEMDRAFGYGLEWDGGSKPADVPSSGE
jgi:tellurite resistance protein TerA